MDELVRQIKGIWIPIEVWTDKSLSWNEKILLMEIDSYTSNYRDCFMSDEFIGDLLGIHPKSANRVLCSLKEKGLIEKTRFDGRKRYIKSTLCYSRGNTCVTPDSTQVLPLVPQECYHTNKELINKNTKYNIPPLSPKQKKNKIEYAEGVSLTLEEYDRLVSEFGESSTQAAIEYLSLYKQEKGYKTKSDNLTIRRWVMDAVNKRKPEKENKPDRWQEAYNYIHSKYDKQFDGNN